MEAGQSALVCAFLLLIKESLMCGTTVKVSRKLQVMKPRALLDLFELLKE